MTKFTAFKNNLFVAMNFDNNGMPYRVITKNPKQFAVHVDREEEKYPPFR